MFIHLSPIDSSCLSFSFVCLHMIIPPPCNFYEASAPHAVTPQGRVSFALFVLRGHFHFHSPVVFVSGMFHEKRLTFQYFSPGGFEGKKNWIIDVIRRRGRGL